MIPGLALVCLAVGAVLLFAGAAFSLAGRSERGAGAASLTWPTPPGTILTSEVTGWPKLRKAALFTVAALVWARLV